MKSTREFNGTHAITRIDVTEDTLTGRAGLHLFVRYLATIVAEPLLDRLFGSLRRSRKGQAVSEIFQQLLVLLVDGICRHLTYFDLLKKDVGYQAVAKGRFASRNTYIPITLLLGKLR